MKYKIGDKVSIPHYFERIVGIITGYVNGFYTVEAGGNSYQFIEEDKIVKLV